jgi:hypothetical protein
MNYIDMSSSIAKEDESLSVTARVTGQMWRVFIWGSPSTGESGGLSKECWLEAQSIQADQCPSVTTTQPGSHTFVGVQLPWRLGYLIATACRIEYR